MSLVEDNKTWNDYYLLVRNNIEISSMMTQGLMNDKHWMQQSR